MKKAILYSFIIILLSDSLIAATYYLQRNGSDSYLGTSEQQAWATFSHAIPRLRPGDELIILDGTYNQTLSISNSGTSSQALTVKAKNDGKVVIDGQNVRVPLFVSGNYVILEGIVAKNSSSDVVQIQGNYNIIRRCSAYNANPNANVHRFTITGSFNLLEDCAAGGTGRYCFLNYDCEGNTLRRCFGKWELHAGGSPRAVYSNYGAENILMENCIGFDVLPNMNTFLEYYGVYQTWASYNTHPTNHCRYYGCIFYQNLQGGFILNPSTGPHSEFIHCVIFNHNQTDPYGGHSVTQCGYGIYGSSQSQMVVRNCTFVNNSQTAVIYMGTDELTNSIFMNNGRAISGGNHRYCCFFNNSTNGVTLNSSDIQVNPSFEDDCYLYIPDSSPCKGAGKDSQDIGANVVYRYVDGVLTNEPLWPWPMNQRILDEIGYDVTGNLIPKYNYGYVEPESILLASPSSGSAPLSVNFICNVKGGMPPYEFLWYFGDGSTSNLQNPNHIYDQIGRYEAKVFVTDNRGGQDTSSVIINVSNPAQPLSITDIKLCNVGQMQEVTQIFADVWYDLYVYFYTPEGWSELSYADIWLNSPKYTEGNIVNRGGSHFSTSSYILSYSIADNALWVKEREGTSQWDEVSGRQGIYVDDNEDEYQQNSTGGWAKARIKLLSNADIDIWNLNAYVRGANGMSSSIYRKNFRVLLSENKIQPPQNLRAEWLP